DGTGARDLRLPPLLGSAPFRSVLEGSASRYLLDVRVPRRGVPDRLPARAGQGEPLSRGAHVRLPLQLVLPGDADAPPAADRLGRAAAAVDGVQGQLVHVVPRRL